MAKTIKILDDESLGKLKETIREGKKVEISVVHSNNCVLKFGKKELLSFDCSRYGNADHNAITSILEQINKSIPDKTNHLTRKKISPLISFKK